MPLQKLQMVFPLKWQQLQSPIPWQTVQVCVVIPLPRQTLHLVADFKHVAGIQPSSQQMVLYGLYILMYPLVVTFFEEQTKPLEMKTFPTWQL